MSVPQNVTTQLDLDATRGDEPGEPRSLTPL